MYDLPEQLMKREFLFYFLSFIRHTLYSQKQDMKKTLVVINANYRNDSLITQHQYFQNLDSLCFKVSYICKYPLFCYIYILFYDLKNNNKLH